MAPVFSKIATSPTTKKAVIGGVIVIFIVVIIAMMGSSARAETRQARSVTKTTKRSLKQVRKGCQKTASKVPKAQRAVYLIMCMRSGYEGAGSIVDSSQD